MSRYLRFVQSPGVPTALLFGGLARLPLAMYPLAILLSVRDLATAGTVVAAATGGYAIVGPALGRLADRVGPTRPLLVTAVLNLTSFGALATTSSSAPGPILIVLGALAGLSIPPVAACQRALWRRLLAHDPELIETAMAVDSLSLDAFLVLGPLLVTGLVGIGGANVALLASAGLLGLGTLGFAVLPGARRHRGQPQPDARAVAGPLRSSRFRLVLLTIVAAGCALGLLRVGLVGYAGESAGLLLAAIGVGSAIGGLWYGGRTWRAPVERRYAVLLLAYALCVLPLLIGPALPLMVVLAGLTGLALSPVTICEFTLTGRLAPEGTTTEAYAAAVTATFAGNALGTAIAGWLVPFGGWKWVTLTAAAALAGAAVLVKLRLGREEVTHHGETSPPAKA